MLERLTTGHYEFHGLLHEYAREQSAAHHADQDAAFAQTPRAVRAHRGGRPRAAGQQHHPRRTPPGTSRRPGSPPWSSPVTKGTANPAVRLGTKLGRGRQLTAVGTHDEASAVGREARDPGLACRPLDRRPRPAAGRPPFADSGVATGSRPRVDE
ncbi:hypothetical protein AB0E27_28720 [Streptomyces sparsogenes]|uniref:hypothetical protein n=1 Tax=Streptomyces sparsogenes TaxID=67365 RepID=UPI0033C1AC47